MGLLRKEDKRPESASGAISYTVIASDGTRVSQVAYYSSSAQRDFELRIAQTYDRNARDVPSS
jgi:hypothetical protein